MKYFKEVLIAAFFGVSLFFSHKFTDIYVVPKQFAFLLYSGVVFIGFFVWFFSKKENRVNIRFDLIDLAVLGYYIYTILQYFIFNGVRDVEQDLFIQLHLLVFYVIVKQYIKSGKSGVHLLIILSGILLFPFIQAVYGLLQYFDIVDNHLAFFEMGGSYGNPGLYANYLVSVFPLGLGILLFSDKKTLPLKLKSMAMLTTILILIVLPLSKARTSWVAATISILLLLNFKYHIFNRINNVVKNIYVKITILLCLMALLFFSGQFLYTYKQDSSSGRLFIWKLSVRTIKENPVFGVGLNNFCIAHNEQQANYFKEDPDDEKTGYLADNILFAFNDYLEKTVETGFLGILLFLFTVLLIVKNTFVISVKKVKPYWYYPVLVSWITILITALFSYPFNSIVINIQFLFFTALLSSENTKSIQNIRLNKKLMRAISLVMIVLMVLVVRLQKTRYKASIEWGRAAKLVSERKYTKAFKIYEQNYETLNYSSYFLYNYGAELSIAGDYKKSYEILKTCEPKLNDADFYTYLGNTYEGLGNLEEAENAFIKASYIIPHKLYPKYRLVYIYAKMNRMKEAERMATIVLNMEPKVESPIADQIKKDMDSFLSNITNY